MLESAGKAAIMCGILKEIAVLKENFSTGLNWGFKWVAIMHTVTLN
jgi:hypothetical protein